MKQRLIKTSFWDEDEWVATLNADETYLYLYLLTNPRSSLCGIYKLPMRYATLETKLPEERIIPCFNRFENDKKIIYKDSWIVLLNRKKHQNPSPKISRGIERELKDIPQHIAEIGYPIDTVSILNGTPKVKVKVKVKAKSKVKVEVFNKESIEYKCSELLFNKIIKNNPSHRFLSMKKTDQEKEKQKYASVVDLMIRIDKRQPEGIKLIIDWSQNNDFWKANILSMEKLREKFDQLVAQARREINENKKNQIPVIQ